MRQSILFRKCSVGSVGGICLAFTLLLGLRLTPCRCLAQGAYLPPAVAEARRITLEQALEYGLTHSPQQQQATHTVAGARANLSGQRSPLNPNLNFAGVNNTVSSLNFRNPDNYTLSGALETSGRMAIRTHQARAQLEGAVADAQTARISVRQGIQAAYITLQAANLAMESERQALEDAQRISELTEQQAKLGSAPETNAINARIALDQERNNARLAATAVEQARAALNQQMGRSIDTPVDASEALTFTPLSLDLNQLEAQALRIRPEIASSESAVRALRSAVKMQRSQYYPDITYEVNGRFDGIYLGVSAPLLDFGSIRGAVRKAKEDVHVQEAQTEQARLQAQFDVRSAWLALQQSQSAVLMSRTEILPRAQSLYSKIEQGYRLGGNTILDLLAAQATLRSARNDLNAAIAAHRQALAALERAVGGPLPR